MSETQPFWEILRTQMEQSAWYYAERLLELGRVQLSFVKERPGQYLILSGIVQDNNTSYQVKISHKPESLTTQCNCIVWTAEVPCTHVGALAVKYREAAKNNETNLARELATHPTNWALTDGIHVERYGTIVRSAPALPGAKMNSTFSSLQYTLTNRKVIYFPVPEKWEGKLRINIESAAQFDEFKDVIYAEDKFVIHLSHLNEAGTETKEVSIFDQLYLFNWKTGAAMDLPGSIKELVGKLKLQDQLQDIQDWLRILWTPSQQNQIELFIKGKPWREYPLQDVTIRASITDSPRKSYLHLDLEIYSDDQHKVPIPSPFLIFVSEQGWGGSFRTRQDAITFYKHLLDDFETETQNYRKYLHPSSRKVQIQEWIDLILKENELYFFDSELNRFFVIRSDIIKKLMTAIMECFQDIAFRTVFHQREDRKIVYQIPKNNLLGGVAAFYQLCSPLDIHVYYDQERIRTWKSNIRFERNKERLDWFELDLLVNQEDLDIIRQAEITDNYLITSKGLLLLTDEQKDLLKFMKRYTKHEGEKKELNQKGMARFGLFLNRARIFELFELKRLGIEGALTEEEEKFCEKILTLKELPTYPVDPRYQEISRPYQVAGYQWLRFLYEHRFGACLADDMGLGKTLQTIMLLQTLKDTAKKVLIICPVSILYNWKNELEKFSDLKFSIYYGDEREIDANAPIILTSYGLMKKESISTFAQVEWDILIFDEVQHLKNIRSLGASSARQLKAKFRVCLTGTPVENDLSEFYNIMDLCVPGVWGELGMIRTSSTSKNRLLARKTVKPFILRRTKEQVLKELPEKIENHIFLDFDENERNNYEQKLNAVRSSVMSGGSKRYGEVLKYLLELRQLCLWQKNTSFHSTKIDYLLENLQQLVEEGHKALVFSQFTTYLDLIENKIREQGWKFARIDGSQAIKKRSEQVDYFQKGEAQVFLISLKAGGFGLNLTAASYIFLMDPWWNPAVERQAIDRAHRIGQENKLTVYRPIIKGSIEEKVLHLQESKRELFKDLMAEDDDQYFSGKLCMDDFQHLLS